MKASTITTARLSHDTEEEEEDEIIEIGVKPTVSKIRARISILSASQKRTLNAAVKDLYDKFMALKSDDNIPEQQRGLVEVKQDLAPLLDYPSRNVLAMVFDQYHNRSRAIGDIMADLGMDTFALIASICNCVWTMSRGPNVMDLSRAIRFRHIDEYQLIQLVDMLTCRTNVTRLDIIQEFAVLPSDALLMLTLVFAELELPAVARKFEQHLSCPSPSGLSDVEYAQLDQDFKQLLEDQYKLYQNEDRNESRWMNQLERDIENFTQEFEGHTRFTDKISTRINELHQLVCKIPQLHIETVVSDSSESDNENAESNDEISVAKATKGFTAQWIQNELAPANLEEELRVQLGQFCFAPIGMLYPSQEPEFDGTCKFGFAKCRVLNILEDGKFEVQPMTPPMSSDIILLGSESTKLIPRNDMAIGDAPHIRCPEGTRVVALCERAPRQAGPYLVQYFSGTIGVKPFTQNRFEYLVFFDTGVDAYVKPGDIRLMMDQPMDQIGKFQPRLAHTKVETRNPGKAKFLKQYFTAYPDWPLIQLKKLENTQRIMAIRNGQRESAFVLDVDRHLSLLRFPGVAKVAWPMVKVVGKDCVVINCKEHTHVDEWVYRGNPDRFPTLAQAQDNSSKLHNSQYAPSSWRYNARVSARKFPSSHFEMAFPPQNLTAVYKALNDIRQKQTAKKRGFKRPAISCERIPLIQEEQLLEEDQTILERKRLSTLMVETTLPVPKYPKMRLSSTHLGGNRHCSPSCMQGIRMAQSDECKIRSPYLTPLLFGWTRMLIKIYMENGTKKSDARKGRRVQYQTPCGIRLNSIRQVANYLSATQQQGVTIDMFTFDAQIRPEILSKPMDEKSVKMEDFTKGREAVPISLVNAVDNIEVDPNFVYRPHRTGIKRMSKAQNIDLEVASQLPQIVQLPPRITEESIDPSFCSGCSCTDDCASSENCECRRMTAEAHERLSESLQVHKSCVKGYNFRQLDDKLISGIYECNSLCKCSRERCFNRVVQLDLKIPLQLFMTAEKCWGVRSLVDIPPGTFVCTYSGEILDEDVAESQGKAISDMYLAELDLIKVVEGEKMNQGIDLISDEGCIIDDSAMSDEDNNEKLPSNTATEVVRQQQFGCDEDEAYQEPAASTSAAAWADPEPMAEEEQPSAIDEEIFMEDLRIQQHQQQASTSALPTSKSKKTNGDGMPKKGTGRKIPPMKLDEMLAYFGDDFLYIVDAAKTGNIGRFLNHSCDPNCQIQHCLVDTHDLRMPWCAFFTKRFVRAGEELCWDYAYEIGSVERQVKCKCGSAQCRGRML